MCNQNQAIAILGEVYVSCNPIFGNAIKDVLFCMAPMPVAITTQNLTSTSC